MDAPVAEYWPEFKAEGKAEIPVRWLLCHKAGLPYVDATLTLEEALAWEPMVRALEAQAPVWEPGTAHGYHATTYGWLVGEVVKRVSGKSLGTFFHDEIARPLGLEFWIGLPDDQQHRVAPLIQWGHLGGGLAEAPRDPALAELLEQFMGPDSLLGKALGAPNGVFNDAEGGFNNPPSEPPRSPPPTASPTPARWPASTRASPAPSTEVPPSRSWTPTRSPRPPSSRPTVPTSACTSRAPSGSGSSSRQPRAVRGARSFGHTGAGGSVGFTDPEHGLGFGYVMNKMGMSLNGDPRCGRAHQGGLRGDRCGAHLRLTS